MGIAWLLRKSFSEAFKIKESQDDWCDAARRNKQLNNEFPENLQYESLVALLRGDAKLNIHCYEVCTVYCYYYISLFSLIQNK